MRKLRRDYAKTIPCPQCGVPTWRFPSEAKAVGQCNACYSSSRPPRRSGDSLYTVWSTMKTRCYNPNCLSYPYYGGAGITVCDQWRNSFTSFRDWAHVNGYSAGLTLERLDGNQGYYPGNCTWVTRRQQSRNRKNTASPEIVSATKAMLAAGVAQHVIVASLKVSKHFVSKIFRGKAWK